MNDVSPVRPAPIMAPLMAAGKPDGSKKLSENISKLPTLTENEPVKIESVKLELEAPATEAAKGEQLQDALGTMQDFVQNIKRELQFTVDQDLGRTVVKVVDSESGDLIRQIPEELFLELARKVKEHGEVNLFNATG